MATRRPRLSQEETERRMLVAAVEQINAAGLTVSLDHLSFEAVIQAADVSRAAAYRRWPNKQAFHRDLLLALGRAATPRAVVMADDARAVLRDLALADPGRLSEPNYRWWLAAEMLRQGTDLNFRTMHNSPEWRTYLALHATFASLPQAELRAQVQATLAAAQAEFVAILAQTWAQLSALLGFRLRAQLSHEVLAELISASIRGLLVMAMADPDLAEAKVPADPFGRQTGTEWSLAALSCASLAIAFFEPEPDLVWDETHTQAVVAVFTSWQGEQG